MDRPTVSSLIARQIGPVPGTDSGRCYICGTDTLTGQKRAPSDLFTAWALCGSGTVICPECAACLSARPVRMRSWMVTADAFRPQTSEDKGWLWDALMDPPEPPYAIYLTQGGQKQGWISGVRQVSLSRDTPVILTDWTDRPISLARAYREEAAPLILRLRAHGVSKRALIEGPSSTALMVKALKEGWADDLRAAQPYAGDPRWEAMAYASN
jgi:hypothetical protein